MSISGITVRLRCVGLIGAALLGSGGVLFGQAPRPFAPPGGLQPGRFIGVPDRLSDSRMPQASRRDVRLYRSAMQQLAAGRTDDAIVYLQTILDADSDGFFEEEAGSGRFASLRSAAAHVVQTLPDEGRQAYLLRYRTAADGLLREAIAEHDAEKLVRLARRFPSTEAGRRAIFLLALEQFDRGEMLAALFRLETLRPHVSGQQKIDLLTRIAVACDHLDDAAARDLAMAELAGLEGRVTLGGRAIPADDREAILAAFEALRPRSPQPALTDWPVAGGDPGRTGFRPAASGAVAEWSAAALTDPFEPADAEASPLQTQLHRWAAQTALVELAGGRPMVPAARPVAAKQSVFFRTPSGLVAVDAATGATRWRSLADPWCWDYLAGDALDTSEGEVAGRTMVGQRLWTDATWGGVATDGRIVMVVEETGAAMPLPAPPHVERPAAQTEAVLPLAFNRLVAYDASTGRRAWEAGGPADDGTPLAGTFFCGAPVPVGDTWFVLGERAGATHLIALDAARSDSLLWSQPVAEHDATIDRDSLRRTGGLTPCVADGLLLCPIGSDLLVAVDPSTRSLLWGWMPSSRNAEDHAGPRPRRGPFTLDDMPGRPVEVAVAGRNAVITSRQAGVSAVEALDGRLRWTTTEFACLWLIGVDAERAYLQTPTGIVALNLTDGSPAWSSPALLGPPSGRGVIIGNRLAVPLADTTLVFLDVETGRKVETRPAPGREAFGNLILTGGSLVSQSATRLLAIPFDDK